MTGLTISILILFSFFSKNVHCDGIFESIESAPEDIIEKGELVFVQVLFRHGDRNILQPYPNDPNKDESLWPEGYGKLTNVGKKQLFELGKYIRRRYSGFLNEKCSSDEIYIRSTNENRTLMSAQYALDGLCSHSRFQILTPALNSQSIRIHTVPMDVDFILNTFTVCERRDFLTSEYLSEIMDEHRPFVDLVEANSGMKNIPFVSIAILQDTLHVEKLKGLTLPKWADQVEIEDLFYQFTNIYFGSFTRTTELKKIETGFFVKELLDRFKNKTLSLLQPDQKIWLYSAHDINIVHILNAFKLNKFGLPSYAASLYFELYKHDSEYYVQIFYRDLNEEIPSPLEIPDCGVFCPLKKLYELYNDILPTKSETHELLCKSHNDHY